MLFSDANVMNEGKHYPGERIWVDLQPWLKSCGYTLRDRYQPGWVASWLKPGAKKRWQDCEDGLVPDFTHLLDASREDGSFVMLKHISISRHPHEVEVGQLFSLNPLVSDPKNRCAPFYDVLRVPNDDDRVILVMPLLYGVENPPFQTVGEVVEFCRQIFEGLQFMHQNHTAHRDCKYNNIMADPLPLYDSPPHPYEIIMRRDFSGKVKVCSTRTQTLIKYYFVDFGLSRHYDPEAGPPLELPPWGGDNSVPEFLATDTPCDPFPVDVYCLGNAVREYFLGGDSLFPARKGLGFLKGLVADMVKDNPKQRPTMDEVVTRFDDIIKGLSSWKLRSRLASKKEGALGGLARSLLHWTKQIKPILTRLPPIPTPSPRR